mgnify:CR=1 FL=1
MQKEKLSTHKFATFSLPLSPLLWLCITIDATNARPLRTENTTHIASGKRGKAVENEM